MIKNQALDFIRSNLNKESLTYQLGFLQGFLAKQMAEKPEIVGEFKAQIRATQNKK